MVLFQRFFLLISLGSYSLYSFGWQIRYVIAVVGSDVVGSILSVEQVVYIIALVGSD